MRSVNVYQAGILHSEIFVGALASRYGFRARDYSLVWDGGNFELSRNVHDLTVKSADGRTFRAQIQDAAIAQQNAWSYVRDIDAGFRSLATRTKA